MNFKKGIIKLCLPFAAVLIFLSGCYKDDVEFVTTGADGEFESFYLDIREPADFVLFNVNDGISLETEDLSRIEVPTQAFVDQNLQVIEDQEVRLEYRFIKEKGELIKYNKPTVSNGELLESGGVFLLEAFNPASMEKYDLNPSKSIRILSSDPNPNEEMALFYGDDSSSSYNWEIYSENVQPSVWGDQSDSTEVLGYEFEMDSLTWVNCDVFSNIPENEQTGLCVELPEIYTNINTMLFVVFKERNSVVSLIGNPDIEQFCDPYELMPIGDEIDIISITSFDNGVYYFGMKNVVLSASTQESIEPERKSIEEINEILSTL